jgi:hypothetical protein
VSTIEPQATTARRPVSEGRTPGDPEGVGWLLFAGVLIMMIAVLNLIYGIAAIANSSFFVDDTRYIFGDLKTWGWVTLIIGVVQVFAAFSIWRGDQFGRWIGLAMASVNALAALLSIPAYPFWSLAIFGVDLLVIYGLARYGGQRLAV